MSRLVTVAKAAALIVVVAIALAPAVAYEYAQPGISWNGSESLPMGLYWHTRARLPAQLGDIVCVHYDPAPWAEHRDYLPVGMLICKKVFGVAGETVRRVGDRIEICHGSQRCRDGGHIAEHDRKGRSVEAAVFPGMIPNGFVYLGSLCSALSFDSRYFGLISESQLVRTLYPIVVSASSRC